MFLDSIQFLASFTSFQYVVMYFFHRIISRLAKFGPINTGEREGEGELGKGGEKMASISRNRIGFNSARDVPDFAAACWKVHRAMVDPHHCGRVSRCGIHILV